MAERFRIQVSPRSEAHASLVAYWSELEGRPVADLCASLLERAIDEALQSGRVPRMAIELMETEMSAREAFCVERHGKTIVDITDSAEEELWGIRPKGPGDRDDKLLAGYGGPGRNVGWYSSGMHLTEGKDVVWTTSSKKEGK